MLAIKLLYKINVPLKTLLASDKIFSDKILPLAKTHSAYYKILLKTPFIFSYFFQ